MQPQIKRVLKKDMNMEAWAQSFSSWHIIVTLSINGLNAPTEAKFPDRIIKEHSLFFEKES